MGDLKGLVGAMLLCASGAGIQVWFGVILPERYGLHIWNISDMIHAAQMWLR